MAHDVDLPGVTPRLLADGDHNVVMAARSGSEPLVAAASVDEHGTYCRVWDLAAGTVIGPPVLGDLDSDHGEPGTFDMVPVTDGYRPTLIIERERKLRVIDARTGTQVAAYAPKHPISEALCLAQMRDRTLVVSVRFNKGTEAPCEVWDAQSGQRVAEFEVWYPHYLAVNEPQLLAGPEIGDGAVLFTSQEERSDDEWPEYVYDHAYLVLIDLATGKELAQLDGRPPVALHTTAGGPVVVCKEPRGWNTTAVRLPGGEHLTTFTGEDARELDILAVGSTRGRDILVGGSWNGGSATVWDLTRPEPFARIETPGLHGVAVALNGAIVLATAHGLFAVDDGALPADEDEHDGR